MGQGSFTPVATDGCAVLGQFAAVLSQGRPLPEALRLLCSGLQLCSAVVRSASGEVHGVGGDALQAVPAVAALDQHNVWLEFPVAGHGATLTVRGGRPSQLPALRAAAAILGLALATGREAVPVADDSEGALSEVADALHDGPLQSLMVARYAADAAVRGGNPGAVRDAVQHAVVELRELVWALRPRGESGLVQALDHLSGADPQVELTLADVDVTGPAAVLAYRLVQSVLARAGDRPVRVCLDQVALEIAGVPLSSPGRWARRASALGCRLITTSEVTRLELAPPAIATFTTDVRTTS